MKQAESTAHHHKSNRRQCWGSAEKPCIRSAETETTGLISPQPTIRRSLFSLSGIVVLPPPSVARLLLGISCASIRRSHVNHSQQKLRSRRRLADANTTVWSDWQINVRFGSATATAGDQLRSTVVLRSSFLGVTICYSMHVMLNIWILYFKKIY